MNPLHVLVVIVVVGVWLAGWIAALSSITSDRRPVSASVRGVWIAVAILLPVVGPLLWFVGGRPYFARTAPVGR
jgi:VIT1/CCC1 family predicted Fe2+/Mn2+ transporter